MMRRTGMITARCVGAMFAAVVLFGVHSAAAQGKFSALQRGATPGEVIRLIGEPLERIERESKREELWRYQDSTVLFAEGRVVSWRENKSAAQLESERVALQRAQEESRHRAAPEGGSAVDDIISEILKEVPSDNSPPAPSAPVSVNPGDPRPLEVIQ